MFPSFSAEHLSCFEQPLGLGNVCSETQKLSPHLCKAHDLTSATTDHFGLEGKRVRTGLTWRMDSGRWAEELSSQSRVAGS